MYKSSNNSRVMDWEYSGILRLLITLLGGVLVVMALEVPSVYFEYRKILRLLITAMGGALVVVTLEVP